MRRRRLDSYLGALLLGGTPIDPGPGKGKGVGKRRGEGPPSRWNDS
jgi:hypothetical protein